jgi:hypothetical protein
LEIREQLNRRLADGEPGKALVEWLNSLPEVKAGMAAAFGGTPVREQNLSEWKLGGYRDWQKQQERRDIVRQWAEDAKELEVAAGDAGFSAGLSMILLAELAQTLRDVLEENTDAGTRLERLLEVGRRFAQLRREESNAARVQAAREQWDQKQKDAEAEKRLGATMTPLYLLMLQKQYKQMLGEAGEDPYAGNLLISQFLRSGNASPVTVQNPTQSE